MKIVVPAKGEVGELEQHVARPRKQMRIFAPCMGNPELTGMEFNSGCQIKSGMTVMGVLVSRISETEL